MMIHGREIEREDVVLWLAAVTAQERGEVFTAGCRIAFANEDRDAVEALLAVDKPASDVNTTVAKTGDHDGARTLPPREFEKGDYVLHKPSEIVGEVIDSYPKSQEGPMLLVKWRGGDTVAMVGAEACEVIEPLTTEAW